MQSAERTVQEVMSTESRYIKHDTTIEQAAKLMSDIDSGFLPISDEDERKLVGVITDRDIVVRAVAEGKKPGDTPVTDCKSDKVLYCYQNQPISEAVASMQKQQVWRLVVLDNDSDKNLTGIVSVGDIMRAGEYQKAQAAAKDIEDAAA
ncbi:MAG: hypothetical protein PsegKO_09850 [Pseudohongiellaceae bacterium]